MNNKEFIQQFESVFSYNSDLEDAIRDFLLRSSTMNEREAYILWRNLVDWALSRGWTKNKINQVRLRLLERDLS